MQFFLKLILGVACPALVSCAGSSVSEKREIINELVVQNTTGSMVSNVVIKVPHQSKLVGTNQILPHSEYAIGFPASRNERAAATLQWDHLGQSYKSEIHTYIPDDLSLDAPARVIIRIGTEGRMDSRIVPRATHDEM